MTCERKRLDGEREMWDTSLYPSMNIKINHYDTLIKTKLQREVQRGQRGQNK